MYVQAKRREGQGVWAVEELERTVAMSTVTQSSDDKPVQVFVVPTHGELHYLMQLRPNWHAADSRLQPGWSARDNIG
ncbi:hypothetical protein [Paraburkholderia hospita]|uniref:hypothetical protein n=1 Tax=Paraburkholderia hospita TaxID=169430 RepID=UPI001FC9FB2F|nr:hypothetical protein [Paraburkholderia hospita]